MIDIAFAMFFKSRFDESIVAWYKTLDAQNVAATLSMRESLYIYDDGHKIFLLHVLEP